MEWKNALYPARSVPRASAKFRTGGVGEKRRQHRPDALHHDRHAGFARPPRDRVGHGFRERLRPLPHAGAREHLQRGEPGRHGQRVTRQRARLVHRTGRCHTLHQVSPAAVCRGRQTAADHLAEAGEIGLHAVEHLGTLRVNPPAGHDLVEYQDGPVAARHRAKPLEEAGDRRDHPHVAGHRLDQQRGDALSPLVEERLHRGEIVEREDDRVAHRRRRHAGRIGKPQRRDAGAGRRQQAVRMSVVAAVELDDEGAAGRGAGQSDRAHRGLGPRADEPHHVHRWEGRHHALRQLELELRRRAERGAAARRLDHGLEDLRMGMPQDQRPPGEHQVHVAVAVHVHQPRALAPLHETRRAADTAERTHGAVDPARNDALRGGEQSLGCGGGSRSPHPGHAPASSASHVAASFAW